MVEVHLELLHSPGSLPAQRCVADLAARLAGAILRTVRLDSAGWQQHLQAAYGAVAAVSYTRACRQGGCSNRAVRPNGIVLLVLSKLTAYEVAQLQSQQRTEACPAGYHSSLLHNAALGTASVSRVTSAATRMPLLLRTLLPLLQSCL
jgi:hypothetical protein